MANVTLKLDEKAILNLGRLDGIRPLLDNATTQITSAAQSMSAGFRTGIWHDKDRNTIGDTPTNYKGDVSCRAYGYVGLVVTGNYSAMKDNYENNTLLKAMGAAHV